MKNSKLETLKAKKEQIEARIKNIEAKERSRAKKDDTRRKILIGAMVMEQMGKTNEAKSKVLASLDGFLTRPLDRKLFGLPEKTKSQNQPTEKPTGVKADATPKKPPQRKVA
jgi:large subunit ribosomal protein L7/L12